jgi:choline dehydrogenase-like flavoprotein
MSNSKTDVIVIGSSLAAYGAILAARKANSSITVIDTGVLLPSSAQTLKTKMSQSTSPGKRADFLAQLNLLNKPAVNRSLPQKSLFGSKYFYESNPLADGHILPFSRALGGYSVGWGGAFLPPRPEDIQIFPFQYSELWFAMNEVAKSLPIPSHFDSLTRFFPNLDETLAHKPIEMSPAQQKLLDMMKPIICEDVANTVLVGQARLLTRTNGSHPCTYCGLCNSGCAFDSIFTAELEIRQLIAQNKISYIPRIQVNYVKETEQRIYVYGMHLDDKREVCFTADKCFMAAGVINSTAIVLRSYEDLPRNITIQKTGGFVRPYFSIRKLGFDWPKQNTQSSIFVEVFNQKISPYWIHCQVATPNELVLQHLGFFRLASKSSFVRFIIKSLLSRTFTVMVNLHSATGPHYKLRFVDSNSEQLFLGSLEVPINYKKVERKADRFFLLKFFHRGFLPIPFTKRGITHAPGYHIGGSIPMGSKNHLSSNALGQITEGSRLHIVDTTTLSAVPGTTVGLLTMSHAYRIVDRVLSKLET